MRHTHMILAGVAVAVMGAAAPAMAAPSAFLAKAMKGDNSEVKIGALAASQGGSAAARQFGRMLQQDHGAHRTKVAALARRHHVPATSAMMPEAQAEYAKLKRMHGTAFDREFGRYMVQDHQKDIADYEQETKSGDPADVRALAEQTLPTLRKHLATAKSIG